LYLRCLQLRLELGCLDKSILVSSNGNKLLTERKQTDTDTEIEIQRERDREREREVNTNAVADVKSNGDCN